MAVYTYRAAEANSTVVTGTVVADTPLAARENLRERGLSILTVEPVAEATTSTFLQRRRGKRCRTEVTEFIRELATLLTAGIPLLSSLRTLAEQRRGVFRAVVQQLADQVSSGSGLAEAMARQSAFFDEMCVSVVRVGENTGALETSLNRLAEFKEKSHRLRGRVTTAMIYPCAVLSIGIVVTIFLMTYVVPNLLSTLVQSGRPLPTVTLAVKAVSDFLIGWWWAALGGAIAVIAAFGAIARTERGRRTLDRAILRVPLVGELARKENTSRIAVVLAALLRSGLQFTEALQITRRTISNTVFRRALSDYESAVLAGSDIAGPLKASGVFRPMVIQMLAVGQQSGQLEDMLEHLSRAYDLQVDTATQRMTTLMEPILIVFLAIAVGFIALATVLPILEAGNVL